MSCPICGPVCQCDNNPESERYELTAPADKPRFPDPESYDASEAKFAASLEQSDPSRQNLSAEPSEAMEALASELSQPSIFQAYEDPAAWKQELAAKLNEYRTRHKAKPPRYPSLQLKFETTESMWAAASTQAAAAAPAPGYASVESTARDHVEMPPVYSSEVAPRPIEPAGRLIEFPRQNTAPTLWIDALADPVMAPPRILEVPESEFLPPALGGISIEPMPVIEEGKRPGIEIPMLAAPMWRRMSAGAIDGAIVAASTAVFGYISFSIINTELPLKPTIIGGLLLMAALWAGYQYLLLVYSGTTFGLKLAGLELNRFDGTTTKRTLRKWRVLASILSGVSLWLGYAWCYLDEDQLCWHDRITKTYMAPKP
ncbi:MAG TPA: RDD family protein [Terriglobales bacterium]|nr:RDD family protein [Terriglobales bacterium]